MEIFYKNPLSVGSSFQLVDGGDYFSDFSIRKKSMDVNYQDERSAADSCGTKTQRLKWMK
jgi:hypothetical protein